MRHAPLLGTAPALGAIDVDAFIGLLRSEPTRYAAVSMVSNVTGIVNPIARLTAAARAEGVPILVDASQAIAHLPLRMDALGEPDALVFSGHKAYAPGSPGVLIVRRDIVEAGPPAELGGGMVAQVTRQDFTLAEAEERDEAGTPDIVGAVTLGAALEVLGRIRHGNDRRARAHAHRAAHRAAARGADAAPLRLDRPARAPRVGLASFNLGSLDHGFVAAVLNDYYNIAVRNQCFCAQLYAQTLLAPELWALEVPDDPVEAEREVGRRRGMVRASLGLHSTPTKRSPRSGRRCARSRPTPSVIAGCTASTWFRANTATPASCRHPPSRSRPRSTALPTESGASPQPETIAHATTSSTPTDSKPQSAARPGLGSVGGLQR